MAAKETKPADYFDQIAAWMRDNGVQNPREIPDAVVEAIRSGAQ